MSEIVTGWWEPRGWSAPDPKVGAIWVGTGVAQASDITAVETAGWATEAGSLVGTHDIEWNAPDYNWMWSLIQLQNPWDRTYKPGGRGSQAYKFQELPAGVTIALPGWLVYDANGVGFEAKGGEPVRAVTISTLEFEYHLATDVQVKFDYAHEVMRYRLLP